MVYEPLKMVFAIYGVEIEKKLLKIWECLAQEKKKTIEMQSIVPVFILYRMNLYF